MHSVTSIFQGVREYLTPVLQESLFTTKGVLTPEEFVQAGDQLVYKCPTWRWEGGEPSKRRSYLPADKQYLVTKNVPCRKRVSSLEDQYMEETEVKVGSGRPGEQGDDMADDGEESWLATHTNQEGSGVFDDEIEDISGKVGGFGINAGGPDEGATRINLMSAIIEEDHFRADANQTLPSPPTVTQTPAPTPVVERDPEFEDMADYEDESLLETDEATLLPVIPTYVKAEEPDENILRTRTYDVSMTYDKYYQTPRVWLFGYDEFGQPLPQEKIFDDIMQDYANRTVTIETHPHLDLAEASIHPCQHAATMKRIVQCLVEGGREARTDQYLFIFLKFIQSVIPTIDYDYTMEVEARTS